MRRTPRLLTLLVVVVPLLSFAQYEELENPGSLSAVQERKFRLRHELTLSGGVLPGDAFYKGLSAQVAYTAHFTDSFAWQVGRGTYSYNVDTGLREQLERDFAVLPTAFEEVEWLIGSDVVWKPLYGKFAVMNRKVIYLEAYLSAGGSAVKVTSGVRPAANGGLGVRLFLTEHLSTRLDFNQMIIVGDKILSVPMLQLGVGFNFGAD